MRVLFIGGTGTISMAITKQLVQQEDLEFDAWCDNIINVLEKAKKEIR